jgi:hypothetical protein
MKSSIIIRGPITITYLRNGAVKIESDRRRARSHVRADEFLRLLHSATRTTAAAGLIRGPEARCGAL